MRRAALAVSVAVLALATACGSTVQVRGSESAGGLAGNAGLGGSQPTASPGSTAAGGGGDAPTSTGGTATGSGASATAQAAGEQSSGTGANRAAGPQSGGAQVGRGPTGVGPGVTASTIKVGIYTAQGFGKFAAQFGASITTGNNTAQAQAVIDYLNAHGGVAGRKIVPVFHDFDITSGETGIDREYQAACTAWTQDDHVYAVVNPVGTADDALYQCLSKAGVITISAGDAKDATFFQKYANWFYQPIDINLRRIYVNLVEGLAPAGFFGSHPKVGVVYADTPTDKAAVDYGLRPALARRGMSLAATFAAPTDNSANAAYSNAVLHFQSQGITHVLFSSDASPYEFERDADQQKYYPRYALQSKNSPSTIQGLMPATAQHGTMGVGWQPMNDVDAAHDPGVISARQALCLKIMKDAHQDTSSRAALVFAYWYCDNLFFLQASLAHAPSFAAAGFRQGAESLADFPSASTYRVSMAPGRLHDGAAQIRLFAFKDDCSCYQYVSGPKPAA